MKRNRIQEMSMEATVGAFVFMVLLALGVFTIVLSRENLFRSYYRYEIQFESVIGIREGDNVLLRGVVIGKIRKVDVAERAVRVIASLDRPLQLRSDYRIEILPTSILGGRSLSIFEGSTESPSHPEGQPIVGLPPVDLIDEATRTVQKIQTALDEGKILQNLEETMQNVRNITDAVNRGEGTLGKLMADDSVYQDLQQIVTNLKDVSGRLAAGECSLGRLMGDQGEIYTDIQAVASNLKGVTDRLNAGEGMLGKLLAADDTMYEDLKLTASSLRGVAAKLESGQGTLGRLISDDALYTDLSLMIGELRATLDDMRETAPITTFSSVLFGAF
ncbi:MAG: MlaD family protein [Kiritimatiellia bacterium]|nr:MlaD family protein [Kiritimatiellia bacterium]